MSTISQRVAQYFEFEKLQTTISTEIIAAISTFLSISYIIIVNPSILSNTGMPFNAVLTATILVSFFSSSMMGLYAKNPIVVVPGMGLNAFFTYTVVLGKHIPWQTALGAVFLSGIVFLILSVFKIRTAIVKAIPIPLRHAISGGIGLFISLIGFKNANFVVANANTLVGFGKMDSVLITFLVGLFLMVILTIKRVKGAILIGIIFTSLASIPIGRWWGAETITHWNGLLSKPDFSLLFQLDIKGAFTLSVIPIIFAFVFTDLFDSLSSMVGIC